MRERRSVNSQEARSIIASAKRELRISVSMVSSSTSDMPGLVRPGGGRSPGREADTMPLTSAPRSAEMMPLVQVGAALRRSVATSRRLYWRLCSADCVASSLAPSSTA